MLLSKIPYLLFILFVLLQTNLPAFTQNKSLPLDDWVKKLDADDDTLNKNFNEIVDILKGMDTAIVFPILNDLEKKGASAGPYFQVRIKHLKATMLWEIQDAAAQQAAKDTIAQLMRSALQQAYQINDEYLIATVSWEYGEKMFYCKEIEPAAMYCLNAVEILDKRGITNDAHKYQLLGEIFYNTRDY